jgi:hypothetical protein
MTTPQASPYTVIGMNGFPHVECGRARAIVREADSAYFFKSGDQRREWPISAYDDFVRTQRITPMEPPVVFAQAAALDVNDIMVVYISSDIKPYLGAALDVDPFVDLSWSRLVCEIDGLMATCLSSWTANLLLRRVASSLIEATSDLLREILASDNEKPSSNEAERVAHAALSAAIVSSDRYSAFIRYGAALRQFGGETAFLELFDTFVAREFPSINRDRFRKETDHLRRQLHPYRAGRQAISPKLSGIAA